MFDVWKNVLADVEQVVPHTVYITFFAGTRLVSLSNGSVKVGAPNVFIVRQLQQKYSKAVESALKKNNVDFTSVEYIVESSSRVRKKDSGREILTPQSPVLKVAQKISARTPMKTVKTFGTGLNPSYTLDSFVVGSNNDLAVSIAKNVVEHPGEKYNPFFLYGGPGLGKTHLVQAIGNEIIKRHPEMRVLYTPTNH